MFTTKPSPIAVRHGYTLYSAEVSGDDGNYHWPITVDVHARGYVGITQTGDGKDERRVLLNAEQFKALVDFVRNADFKRA